MKKSYQGLYLAQFITAILVVVLHGTLSLGDSLVIFFIRDVICRIAVPFFFINNAFFFQMHFQRHKDTKKWLINIVKVYTLLYILYLPLGVHLLLERSSLPWYNITAVLALNYGYIGSFIHLWYFPAMILSIIVINRLIQNIGTKTIFIISLLLFALGSVETYSAFITNTHVKNLINEYFKIFYTTRNALFISPIFITIGFVFARFNHRLNQYKNHLLTGLMIASVLGVIEGLIVFSNQGSDHNFMYFTILFTSSIFGLLLLLKNRNSSFVFLKDYSRSVFFLHMIPLYILDCTVTLPPYPKSGIMVCLGILLPCIVTYLNHRRKRKNTQTDTITL